MKLGKTAWLILIIGVFIIAIGSLYWLYLQEGPKQEELSQTLSRTQALLPLLAADRTKLENTLTELEDKLVQAVSQLEIAKAAFPNTVQSIEVDELLFGIAGDWDLEIVNLFATEPSDETVAVEMEESEVEESEVEYLEVEDVIYQVTYFAIDVKGKAPESDFKTEEEYKAYIDKAVDDILNFINTIATHEDITTATVKLVSIVIPKPLSEKEKDELTEELIEKRGEIEVPSATIQLVIYSYEGE